MFHNIHRCISLHDDYSGLLVLPQVAIHVYTIMDVPFDIPAGAVFVLFCFLFFFFFEKKKIF